MKTYYTAQEVADRYRVTLRTIRTLVATGRVPRPIYIGRSQRWTEEMLSKYEKKGVS